MDPKHSYKVFNLLMEIHNTLFNNEKHGRKLSSKFRTRARDIPSQVKSYGLAYTMLYLYSKATKSIYNDVEKRLERKNTDLNVENKEENVSYAIYLYIIKKLLVEVLGYNPRVSGNKTEVEMYISSMLKDGERDSMAYGQALIPYLLMVKRFAEAMYESESG